MKHKIDLETGIMEIGPRDQYINPCYVCGTVCETRPYGENEQEICYDCAQLPRYNDIVLKHMRDMMDLAEEIIVRRPYLY